MRRVLKVLPVLLAIGLLASATACTYKPKYPTVEFNALKAQDSNWAFVADSGTSDDATVTENKDGSVLFDVTWNIGYMPNDKLATDNKLLHFNFSTSSITSSGVVGFVMKCNDTSDVVWKSGVHAYVINILTGKLELQKRVDGNKYTVLYTAKGADDAINTANKKYDVYVGAINESKGVRILLVVDGKEVINYLDSTATAYKAAGPFGLMCCTAKVTLS